MNIELQVGKRYEARNGVEVSITRRGEKRDWPVKNLPPDRARLYEYAGVLSLDDSKERCWRSDGVFDDTQVDCSLDLIRELPDATDAPEPEPAAEPEPVSDTQAPLRLEVGKWYRARNGEVVQIDRHDPDRTFGDNSFPFIGGIYSYAEDGQYSLRPSRYDLIEEIPAPVAEAVAEMEFETIPLDGSREHLTAKIEDGAIAEGAPATEKVVAHWDRERFIGIDAGVPGESPVYEAPGKPEPARIDVSFTKNIDHIVDPPLQFDLRPRAINSVGHKTAAEIETSDRYEAEYLRDKADQRLIARADRFATYAQAAMFAMFGVAAIIFAIGTSVQA